LQTHGLVITLLGLAMGVAAPLQAAPTRVLVLLGGEYHPYEAGARMLIEAAGKEIDLQAEFVRIDNPPADKPEAEEATIPSNPAILADPDLRAKYDVIFAYHENSWVDLTPEQIAGYLAFVRFGGGLVALHSTCEPITKDPEYVPMIGGRFVTHEPYRKMTVEAVAGAGDLPLLEGVAGKFDTVDEFYYVDEAPLVEKRVIQTARSPEDGKVRPITWIKRHGKGRVFCTLLGHSLESCRNSDFQRLVQNALAWAAAEHDAGFVPLFDGTGTDGWEMVGDGGFRVEDGILTSQGGWGLFWYSKKKFRDFVLRVEWRVNTESANSGIFLRFPERPDSPWYPVNNGYEVQIADTNGPRQNTGSIFAIKGSAKVTSRPPGQWNLYEIIVVGQEYKVILNGQVVNRFEGDRGREGYIGLQNHDAESILSVRRIDIREVR
jgi:type 1 glutamine amidotransferase